MSPSSNPKEIQDKLQSLKKIDDDLHKQVEQQQNINDVENALFGDSDPKVRRDADQLIQSIMKSRAADDYWSTNGDQN